MATGQKSIEHSETNVMNNCRTVAYNDAENRLYQKPATQTFSSARGAFRERTDLYNPSRETKEATLAMKVEKELEILCTESSVNLFDWIFEDESNHRIMEQKQPILCFTIYEDNPAFGLDEARISIPSSAPTNDTCSSTISNMRKGTRIPNPSITHEANNLIPSNADAYSSTLSDLDIDVCHPKASNVSNDSWNCNSANAKDEMPAKRHVLDDLKDSELDFLPRSDYMAKQPQISYELRSESVDWMIHVAEVLDLECETLFLAVNYLDRFLSKMSISKDKMRFLGLVALYIASNQTAEFEANVGIFVNLMQDAITEFQVLELEKRVRKTLVTGLGASTAYHFVTQLLQAVFASWRLSALTCYLLELTLIEGKAFLKYIPSITATSCFCLANALDEQLKFMGEVTYLTGYDSEDLNDCISDVFGTLHKAYAKTGLAVREKYSSSNMCCVAEMKLPDHCPTNFT